ncbi:hypothetical protein GCM10010466_23490 [Planomonospora alba]|uniref:Serine/arginine repetitive matrix protein 2 n=1 Tax=Planomonospora alba TaxID=161354 RepID=A0ABP6N0G2_9ACTN
MSHDFGTPAGGGHGAPGHAPSPHAPAQPYGGHGYAPPGYGAPAGPPPKVKPGIGWIVGAWLLAFVSIGIGVLVAGGAIFGGVTDAAPTSSFGSGEFVKVALDKDGKHAVYVNAEQGTRFECGFQQGTPEGTLTAPVGRTTVTDGDTVWEQAFLLEVDQTGEYTVGCAVQGEGQARFGVGKELAAGSIVGGVAAFFLIPAFGFLLAIIVTVVVLVKRSRARRRIAAGAW